MTGIAKLFMTIGIILFFIGLVMHFIPLGKLPGDIVIKKGNTTFYFPVVTSIMVSVVLSIIFYLIGKFR
ncbi:DUF2905 domain-containing protein [Bacillus sp. 03113]|uniref:DUF2905 domain-containing protein n=1 Tax=Bacillus sp. 03113 TaxID=2578211 RepID=UPI001143492A|nr:DUF2905 domain-containing protein [Bacillus sp. 03113]